MYKDVQGCTRMYKDEILPDNVANNNSEIFTDTLNEGFGVTTYEVSPRNAFEQISLQLCTHISKSYGQMVKGIRR